ncbi:solute carrier family 45 member 4-like [Sinocyclocheilus rhinocerous]|uniref:Solute carrier family 45 member 4-like n=1 Tax=Sinocyclocheilus rhinocerous TaxID=307959 RepID=A0A673MXX4_9TELE|nr:PREDICTED: solute carrier family 45 member 4-like [Sinocyclocheilus rhinocerous]XP_016409978.1 PREDICTED: solute carrier family 45 member 4-like [Sinocyclocheilus rhinocerous]XP_016409979.1 PREDICTED: solute carrier family 45 member 4-like [Sinocyclocheilus rhinocerous]XP_016409980.1 PREDICTED: solute carrier family 45 member 4-like [Sinocyclocheilus rhinocerous]
MQASMAPKNAVTESVPVLEMAVVQEKDSNGGQNAEKEKEREVEMTEDSASEDSVNHIPKRLWVMHGAIMFGREFCYAMETALVTPVLLQLGLPEQYYSLTWFLSPILGLIFTPLIGSASDRCTLKWGRRRPFILALCIGVLLGVALFLNGSLIGLSLGDVPSNQLVGIVLTVVGVVVLDFCADALDGPIRAYLLDVADTEEQDMALNIHAFSAGLGGALGYMLGGLDWTNTFLGRAFKAQEQVLFFFAAIIFIISATLHLFSIKERLYNPNQPGELKEDDEERPPPVQHYGSFPSTRLIPQLELIPEEELFSAHEDDRSEWDVSTDFLNIDLVRCKSDSVLAMPDATVELDPDLDLDRDGQFLCDIEPTLFQDFQGLQDDGTTLDYRNTSHAGQCTDHHLQNCDSNGEHICGNGSFAVSGNLITGAANAANQPGKVGLRPSGVLVRHRTPSFYRQPSFTFSYHGRVGFQWRRRYGNMAGPIKSSRSLNDIDKIDRRHERRKLQPSRISASRRNEEDEESEDGDGGTTVKLLWLSMLKMPPQLWRLCVCHLLTWFSMIAQAVFYTDFMGQVIFEGDPTAAANSTTLQNYSKGVQMGCWGLVIYAATAALCSDVLQRILNNYDLSIKIVYMLGTLGYAVGTAIMFIFPNVYVAMVMISTMGIISMSMSYCPYALLGQYHEIKEYIHHSPGNSRRGFGIDCAILTCQVYISQILVASALGAVVDAVGTVRVIPMVAAGGSFLGFLAAAFLVIYPDTLDDEDDDDDEDEPGPSSVKSEAASSNSTEKLKQIPRNSSSKPEVESSV